MKSEIAIIGGGAAGVIAAIEIKKNNIDKEVIILEKKDRILKKVLVTGNGRCNITNAGANIYNYFSIESNYEKINKNNEKIELDENMGKIKNILDDFNVNNTIEFFENIGIVCNVENRGKIYPLSGQASSVVDALRFKCEQLGVKFITDFNVNKIEKEGFKFKVYSEDKKIITCNNLLLAAGGQSYPELGSNGSGFQLAKELGHKITRLSPTIVQLKTDKNDVKGLQGIKLNTNVTAYGNGKKICTYDGELLFTDYGISGNVVFNISFVVPLYENIEFEIDFMPKFSYNDLYNILQKRKKILSTLTMEHFFNGMINKKLGQFLCKKSGIEKLSKMINTLTDSEIKKICQILKKYKITILDTTGYKNAQVTAGGISLNEVNLETLESKKIKGLYFAGEVLDIYGECGGYNLQWAWASGIKVGKILGKN